MDLLFAPVDGLGLGVYIHFRVTTKLGGLKQHKRVVSQFWRLKVPAEGISKAVLPPKGLRKKAVLPLLASLVATLGVRWQMHHAYL